MRWKRKCKKKRKKVIRIVNKIDIKSSFKLGEKYFISSIIGHVHFIQDILKKGVN